MSAWVFHGNGWWSRAQGKQAGGLVPRVADLYFLVEVHLGRVLGAGAWTRGLHASRAYFFCR
jgi:hypothetical protein